MLPGTRSVCLRGVQNTAADMFHVFKGYTKCGLGIRSMFEGYAKCGLLILSVCLKGV